MLVMRILEQNFIVLRGLVKELKVKYFFCF
jgi:hypothetical protein